MARKMTKTQAHKSSETVLPTSSTHKLPAHRPPVASAPVGGTAAEGTENWSLQKEKKVQAMLPVLSALNPAEVVSRALTPFDLVTMMRLWLKNIEKLRPEMQSTFTAPPLDDLDALPDLLDVAEQLSLDVKTVVGQKNLQKLVREELIPARKRLRNLVVTLVDFAGMNDEVLRAPLDGRSTKDVAHDILQLVNALRLSWNLIQHNPMIKLEQLNQAEVMAREALAAATSVKELQPASNSLERSDLLDRAITLILRSYTKVRGAVQYIRLAQGDADDFAPSPYVIRNGGRPRSAPDKSEPSERDDVPEISTPPATYETDEIKPVDHTPPHAA